MSLLNCLNTTVALLVSLILRDNFIKSSLSFFILCTKVDSQAGMMMGSIPVLDMVENLTSETRELMNAAEGLKLMMNRASG